MKYLYREIKEFYHKGDNQFYFSLAGPLAMGTIHLIYVLNQFDWLVLNYCMFSYLMAFIKVWQWSIEKFKLKPNNYIAGVISVFVLLTPLMVSLILTITTRDNPYYIFDWLVYAYALYGTVKMVLAIKKLFANNKTEREYTLSLIGLIAALYTIQMMEFRLIMFGGDGQVDDQMYLLELFTQGAIFIFTLVVIVLLIIKQIKRNKVEEEGLN